MNSSLQYNLGGKPNQSYQQWLMENIGNKAVAPNPSGEDAHRVAGYPITQSPGRTLTSPPAKGDADQNQSGPGEDRHVIHAFRRLCDEANPLHPSVVEDGVGEKMR